MLKNVWIEVSLYFSSTAALLQKLAKENDDAAIVMRKAEDIEHTQSLTNSNRYWSNMSEKYFMPF